MVDSCFGQKQQFINYSGVAVLSVGLVVDSSVGLQWLCLDDEW